MRAGELNKRVDIQSRSLASDSMGGYTTTWVTLASSVPAGIKPLSSSEALDAMKLENQVTHKITMRYRTDINAGVRIVFGNRTFNIVSVACLDEKRRQLDILAVEEI